MSFIRGALPLLPPPLLNPYIIPWNYIGIEEIKCKKKKKTNLKGKKKERNFPIKDF